MNTQNPFDNLTPEFVRENIKKVTEKLGVEVDISDEKINAILTKFKETAAKTQEMRQDAVAFKEELEKLVSSSQDGNGNFSADYFYRAVSNLEKRLKEADLKETDRSILEGLVSGAKNIAGFWVDKKAE